MSDDQACKTPMSDHIARFWELLRTEYVRVLIDIRREHDSSGDDRYHWDSASFGDDTAKALVNSLATLTTERDAAILERDETNTDLNDRIADLNAERDGLKRALAEMLKRWTEQQTYLEQLKAGGGLTRDWGECSLTNARRIVRDLQEALASTPPLASDDTKGDA